MHHDRDIRRAFTAQVDSFNTARVANADDVLDEIVSLAEPRDGQRWLEAACGPGIIARRFAPLVDQVEGIDLTPAMVDTARREAAAAGLTNATFAAGDVTDLDRPEAFYDGAVTRFSIHHMPVPERLVAELARVVRPGGRIVVVDHIADTDADAAIWSQEIERLRDPSHWACRTATALRTIGEHAGLRLVSNTVRPLELDFEDWLDRGGADPTNRVLVEIALRNRPATAGSFEVRGIPGNRTLTLQGWFGVWTR